jgi:Na+-translocating ferredoxin:NAD+ oxidoreductase RnfG subunit
MKLLQIIITLLLISFASNSYSKIYYSKSEALELAFGKAATVEVESLFPDDVQIEKIQQLAKTKLESGLFSFYVGKDKDKLLGYAAIESETVRTKPETLMIVLSPTGELSAVHLLAFHEPPEYQAPQRWFESLIKKSITELELNKGVDGISGATLSTRSALTSIRKVMAFYQIMVKH